MKKAYPQIPQHELDAIVRIIFPHIQKFYESEDGKRAFEAWKREQETQAKHSKP